MPMNCSVLSHDLISSQSIFIKLILSMYDHNMMMGVNFHEKSSIVEESFAIWSP